VNHKDEIKYRKNMSTEIFVAVLCDGNPGSAMALLLGTTVEPMFLEIVDVRHLSGQQVNDMYEQIRTKYPQADTVTHGRMLVSKVLATPCQICGEYEQGYQLHRCENCSYSDIEKNFIRTSYGFCCPFCDTEETVRLVRFR
jgi:hypothetical protein